MPFPSYTLSEVATGGVGPWGICVDSNDFIWSCDFSNAAVYVINSTTKLVVKTIALNNPNQCCYDLASNTVWVSWDNGAGVHRLEKFDAATQTSIATYPVAGNPGTGALCSDGTNIWFAKPNLGQVGKYVIATGALVNDYATAAGCIGVCFDSGTATIWTANSTSVSKLLAATGALLGTFAIGSAGQNQAVISTNDGNIWCTTQGEVPTFIPAVAKINATTGAVITTIPLLVAPPTANGAFLTGLMLDGNGVLWVIDGDGNNGDNAVFAIDPVADSILGQFLTLVDGNPVLGTVTSSNEVWVSNNNNAFLSVLTPVVIPPPIVYFPIINTKTLPFFQLPFCVTNCHCL